MDLYYAILSGGVVVNLIFADQDFIDQQIASEAIEAAIEYNPTTTFVEIGQKYEGGMFVTALTKPQAIAARVAQLKVELFALRDCLYDKNTREAFHGAILVAQYAGKTNRLAYLMQLLTWLDSVQTFIGTIGATLMGQPDAQAVVDYQWDLSSITATDPHLTLLTAFQIPD